jgi:aldehyde dehydrogenase (NAD+)
MSVTAHQIYKSISPRANLSDAAATVRTLHRAFSSGRTRSLHWRREQLSRLRALLVERADALLAALREDLGKPGFEAYATDLAGVVAEIDLAVKYLPRWTRPERVAVPWRQLPGSARILREPLGVVLIIAPWNYPVQLSLNPLVGAIAAGNCVALKPSEVAEHTSHLLAELIPRYLDAECVAVVEGGVDETTALLDERFDHVFYTGNGAVGRVVMAAAAKHLTPVTLELGGKSPCIVAADARLDVAARRIAWGKFLNAGQTCIAPDYVLVEARREAELLSRLRSTLAGFYGGDPRRSPDYGRIVSDRHYRRLARLLDGPEIAIGGEVDPAERYIAPTVLRNVRFGDPVMQEEIFGPILPVLTVRDVDEAIELVNVREKPLALYVFTESEQTAERVLEETSSGGACVNGTLWQAVNPHLPFGGVGASGMGSYHGHASFETFSHRKAVARKPTRLDPRMAYPPFTAFKERLIRQLF